MNGSPSALTQPGAFAAQRLRQQEARLAVAPASAVGWNCTNSRSATRAPARHAIAMPSPDATSGLVVSRNTCPAPPVASSVARARTVCAGARRIEVADADGAAVLDQRWRWRARARRRGCADARRSAPTACRRSSRPVVSRACSTRRTLCAASRASAISPFGCRSKAAPQSISSCDVGRALPDQDAHRVEIAQPVAGGQRVLRVQLGIVVVADRGGDAALRVAGVALGRRRLGQEQHLAGLRQLQRRPERGDPAADDEEIRRGGHGRRAPAATVS